jgi:sigma-B regulation protein RsbU (phosphoserine phosphatase)
VETDRKKLIDRIESLESELAARERDVLRYRTELAKANTRLETLIAQVATELRAAHLIQKALVPTEFPNIPGFEFSTQFLPSLVSGGDYFDIFEHEDRFRFGLVVASSSGHAMSALFLSVLLKLSGQMEARKGVEPHVALNRFAQELVPNIEGNSEAHVLYAVMDRRRYDIAICRAGNILVLHQEASTGEVKVIPPQFPAFSHGFQSKLASQTLSLNPKDRLILCTQGMLEVTNLKGEVYGIERLVQSILKGPRQGVHELRNHVVYSVQKYGSGQDLQRDLTLVVLEVKERIIKLAKKS